MAHVIHLTFIDFFIEMCSGKDSAEDLEKKSSGNVGNPGTCERPNPDDGSSAQTS